jgi:hypothetical protein
MEPTTSTGAAFALSKLWYALGGSFSGGALGVVWRPAALQDYSKFMRGLIIGGIGAGAPVMVGSFVAMYFGMDPYSADVGLFIGSLVGLLALAFFVFVANYLKKNEHKDIFEVARDAKKQVQKTRKPTATATAKPRPARRKPASRKTTTQRGAK